MKNDGIAPQYYIEDDHEAIIPKELFYYVQEEKAGRTSMSKTEAARKAKQEQQEKEIRKYSSKFALSEIMVCRECVTGKIKILRLTKGFDVDRFI